MLIRSRNYYQPTELHWKMCLKQQEYINIADTKFAIQTQLNV